MNGQLPDFDTLMQMAKDDPQALEQLRQDSINELLDNAPANMRRRLEGLQFQIDAKRKLAKTPMQACITISRMMHESFEELRQVLNSAFDEQQAKPEISTAKIDAQILSFEAPAIAR